MKRSFDFIISLTLLVLFSPVMIVVAVLIRIKLGSPILFIQKRPGLNDKPFHLFKFRTMLDREDGKGNPLPDEARLTSFGKLIRRYSLDEFPQLFNVLKGDMSLVGPRPLLMEYLSLYTKEQALRHCVRPGITGWAQVNGRNALTWEQKFDYDLWYVRNQSFLIDLKIINLTILKVIKSENISNGEHVTMPVFRGNNHYEG